MKKLVWAEILLILTGLLIGCKEGKTPKTKTLKNTFVTTNAWIRPAAKNMNSAMYFDIINNTGTADTLLGAESDLAKSVQIHETFESGKDMMGMRHVDFVPIKANGTVHFKPSGYHVMLIGLNKDLKQGDKEKITLIFKKRGKANVIAKVKNQ